MKFETVIGLEIHAQLLTRTKLFCSCPSVFGEEPNTRTCPVCLGLPGSLPVLNARAVELAVKGALALNCTINETSIFARKNYFYPDLPKGYQISQYDRPLAEKGHVEIISSGKRKRIGITRVHVEEDAGKLLHEGGDERYSIIDYNRSCVPLIEIVSDPEISSPSEAAEYLKMLRLILIYNGVCDGNMELGSLRCDANLSVREPGEKKLGTKTELKNMNSVNFIEKALEYEAKRHASIIESGGRVTQATLLWDQKESKTVPMRTKEEAHDYRYFSEPDLLPLKVEHDEIERIKDTEIITSSGILQRLDDYLKMGIPRPQAETLVNSPYLTGIFSAVRTKSGALAKAASLITVELPRIIGESGKGQKETAVDPSVIAEIVDSEEKGEINFNTAKELLAESLRTGKRPSLIIKEKGLTQISSGDEIDAIIEKIVSAFPSQVSGYKQGKEALFNFLLGQVMKESKGKVNPKIATERLKEKLRG